MVRLRPPSVPVGARWNLTPPRVIFTCLLMFTLALSNDHFASSSIQDISRNLSSHHTYLNMGSGAQRTLSRSRDDLTIATLEVEAKVGTGMSRSVARKESSSVGSRKLNRLKKHALRKREQLKSEKPNLASVNLDQVNLVGTGQFNRPQGYRALQNLTTASSRGAAVSHSLGSEFENVNLTVKSTALNRQWVPRVMLDLYEAALKPGHASPYGADIVRSFTPLEPVSVMNQSLHEDSFAEEDNRGYEGRGGVAPLLSSTPNTVSYSFPFQLVLPKGEHVRNLLLRLHTIVGMKRSPAGLERRLRVLVARHPTSASRAEGPVADKQSRLVEVARKDVYLNNHSWLTLNMRPLLRHLGSPGHIVNVTLILQIERAFAGVGDTGELAVDPTSGIDFQPLLLLYTSQPNLARQAKHQFLHFASRSRRSVHENDWDWDGREDVEEDEPEPPGRDPGRKGRRAGRRRRAKNTCKRRPLKVDFESIGWQDWVIAPVEYEAYQCSGKCFYPLASHLNPTKHAVIQTLMHSRSSERARRACCVPTLLGPISLLYLEDGVPTFKKEYDDMVALECGCR